MVNVDASEAIGASRRGRQDAGAPRYRWAASELKGRHT
jgi:hypothetical protein